MGWAGVYIAKLKEGQTVKFRPRGNSMTGKIDSGNLVTVEPIKIGDGNLIEITKLNIEDIVLCKVKGQEYLHLIKAIRGEQYLIGNNKGHLNGWTNIQQIFGKVVRVEK